MPRSHPLRAVLVTLALAAGALPASAQQDGRPNARPRPKPIDPFRFKMMGPAVGGRIAAKILFP